MHTFSAKLLYNEKEIKDIKLMGSKYCGSNIMHHIHSDMFVTTIKSSLLKHKIIIFPHILPLDMLTFVMTHFYLKWKLHLTHEKMEWGALYNMIIAWEYREIWD